MKLDSDEKEEPELHGACYNYDDFFRWTKHELPEGLILNGRITRFDNDLVIRYLENVTVFSAVVLLIKVAIPQNYSGIPLYP